MISNAIYPYIPTDTTVLHNGRYGKIIGFDSFEYKYKIEFDENSIVLLDLYEFQIISK